jgi:hypothetical protein
MTSKRAERPHALEALMRRALLFSLRPVTPSGGARAQALRRRPAANAPATAREDMW